MRALYASILGLMILDKDIIQKAKNITQSVSEEPWLRAHIQLITQLIMLGMLGKAHYGYQHVQNTPVKPQYDHSFQHHQRSQVLFMANLTSRNREHSVACAT